MHERGERRVQHGPSDNADRHREKAERKARCKPSVMPLQLGQPFRDAHVHTARFLAFNPRVIREFPVLPKVCQKTVVPF
jgi:hypothetical protein